MPQSAGPVTQWPAALSAGSVESFGAEFAPQFRFQLQGQVITGGSATVFGPNGEVYTVANGNIAIFTPTMLTVLLGPFPLTGGLPAAQAAATAAANGIGDYVLNILATLGNGVKLPMRIAFTVSYSETVGVTPG